MSRHIPWLAGGAGLLGFALGLAGVIPSLVGWAVLLLGTGTAAATAYWQYRHRIVLEDGCIRLTLAMVKDKSHYLPAALEHLQQGGHVIWCVSTKEEVTLSLQKSTDFNVVIAANRLARVLDEGKARRILTRARTSLQFLTRFAPEFAALVASRKLVISLLSEFGPEGVVICHEIDGVIYWEHQFESLDRAASLQGAA